MVDNCFEYKFLHLKKKEYNELFILKYQKSKILPTTNNVKCFDDH